MAIYQFVIELIPNLWVKENGNSAVDLLCSSADAYDTSIAWESNFQPESFEHILSDILPLKKSWHEDLTIWGNEEFNDIQIWKKNGSVESIKIRLDLRSNNDDLKIKIINLSKILNCDFFIPSVKKIIKPNIEYLNEIIASSNSAKFVNSPGKFFDELK